MEDRLALQEARLAKLEASWEERVKSLAWWEDRLAAWEARVKTLERNNPLEARLRAVESSQATMVAKVLDAASFKMLPFAWMQFAFRWAGMLRNSLKGAVAKATSKRQPPSSNQQPLSTKFAQQSARHEALVALHSKEAAPTLQSPWDLEVPATTQLRQHAQPPELPESRDDGVGDDRVLQDSSTEHLFVVQDGLEGYSKSLALAPDAADKIKSDRAKISLLHREACKRGLDTYIDQKSGYEVFTAYHLKTRECCGSSCRHCPWGHCNVPGRNGTQKSVAEEEVRLGASIENLHKDVIPKSRLYTRKGDSGYTNLYNEKWILKSEPVYDAIGDVDELNSAVGLAHALLSPESETRQQLEAVQAWLLDIGSALCTPRGENHGGTSHARKLHRTKGVTHSDVTAVETFIDKADAQVSELRNFILPGGTPAAAALQVARTVCRRAERRVWPLLLADHCDHVIGIFLNRLSDYLFVAARLEARITGASEKHYRIERKMDRWQRKVVDM